MARHWPGPLTLVLTAGPHVPAALTAGSGTVGVRCRGHAVALALVRAAGRPLTAPSANPSGAPPPTTAAAVRAYFASAIDLIVDGGPTAGGTGSTVADCTTVAAAHPPARGRLERTVTDHGVIQAGGKSTRMGGEPKALMELGGRRVIDRVVDVLASVTDDLLVVTNTPELTRRSASPWCPTSSPAAARSAASTWGSRRRRARRSSPWPATCRFSGVTSRGS